MNTMGLVLKFAGGVMLLAMLSLGATHALTQGRQDSTSTSTPTMVPQATTVPCETYLATEVPCDLLQPGDRIGDMRLDIQKDDETYMITPSVFDFCAEVPCTIPNVPRLAIGPFVTTSDGNPPDAGWAKANWEVDLDGHPINVKAFGTVDFDYIFTNYKARAWRVVLDHPTPGDHVLHVLYRADVNGADEAATNPIEYFKKFTMQQDPCPGLLKADTNTAPILTPLQDTAKASFLGVAIDRGQCGVMVAETVPDSQAAKIELQKGDLIRSVDGVPIITLYQLRAAIGNHHPGDRVSLVVDRKGEQIEVHATLTGWPATVEMSGP